MRAVAEGPRPIAAAARPLAPDVSPRWFAGGIRQLTVPFSAYFLSSILNAAIPFLLLPLLTRYLDPGEFGILAVFQASLVLATPFCLLNVAGAVSVAYFRLEKGDLPSYVSSAVLPPLVATGIVLGLASLARAGALAIPGMPARLLTLLPLFCLAQMVPTVVLALLQARQTPAAYGMYQIVLTACNFALSTAFVVLLRWSYQGRLLGIFLAYAIATAWGLVLLSRAGLLTTRVSLTHAMDAVKFGLPLIPHAVAGSITGFFDRLVISRNAGVESAGLYAAGAQIAALMLIFVTAVNQSWMPRLFELLKGGTPADNVKIVRYTTVLIAAILIVGALFVIATPLIFRFAVGHRYAAARGFIPWLVLAYTCNGLYYVFVNWFFYFKKTFLLGMFSATASVLSVALNLTLVPRFGAMGAAYAALASAGLLFLLVALGSQALYGLPWRAALRPHRA